MSITREQAASLQTTAFAPWGRLGSRTPASRSRCVARRPDPPSPEARKVRLDDRLNPQAGILPQAVTVADEATGRGRAEPADLPAVVLNQLRPLGHGDSLLPVVTTPTALQKRAFRLQGVRPDQQVPIRMTAVPEPIQPKTAENQRSGRENHLPKILKFRLDGSSNFTSRTVGFVAKTAAGTCVW